VCILWVNRSGWFGIARIEGGRMEGKEREEREDREERGR
jgi:hypothetical protein